MSAPTLLPSRICPAWIAMAAEKLLFETFRVALRTTVPTPLVVLVKVIVVGP